MNDCALYAVMFVFVHCTANDGILMTKCVVDEFISNFDCVDAESKRSVSAKDTRTKRSRRKRSRRASQAADGQ